MHESQTPPVLADLTGIEQAVVDAARHGTLAEPGHVAKVAELAVTDDPGLRVRATVLRELLLGRRGALDPRGLRVRGVRVTGRLDLDHVTAVTGLSLVDCALPDGVTCRYARLRELVMRGSLVSRLVADGLDIDGTLSLANATLRGTHDTGMVRLHGAHVGGQLHLDGSKVTNDAGPALLAGHLRTDDNVFLRHATLRGAGELGTVRLLGAQLGGQLHFDGSEIVNDTGPALQADRLHTNLNLFLRDATLRGAGPTGTVRLHGAHIGGQAHFTRTRLSNDSGPLLMLTEAKVDGALLLPTSVVCPASGIGTTPPGCADRDRQIGVHGLVFPNLGGVSWQQWLHLLVHHTSGYRPQPYQQLAAVERAAGHDNNARHVLITQQEDLRRRTPAALGGRAGRARHRLWGWLGRYGYRAHRLVISLAVVLAVSAALGWTAGQIRTRPGHHAAERVPPPVAASTTAGTPCTTTELIGLGIDRGLPLGALGVRARCDFDTGTRWGQAFTYAIWALQVAVWALATLAIAAYTGLVRKPT